jgi:tetratricopeptide (TPR) repeat protein
MGRSAESLQEAELAHELDPLSPSNTTSLATQYRSTGRYDRAIEQLRTVLELDPNFALAHQGLGKTYERMGLWKLAIDEFQNSDALAHDSESLASLGHAYGASGDRAAALKITEQLSQRPPGNYVSPYDMAAVFAGLGDSDKAFAYLDQAYRDRDSRMPFLAVDSWFEPLRSDRRFVELCHRLGLPTVAA